ncbi:hypothetical protein C2G38_2153965 [Gigaspora rosea]|uniref:Uncharacterized protein n=1 Tax=Gigaspora rosea TaxID=44941 RepID=A0A397W9C1_9GLOM|nr:hypothetical protein C2G38_2153965 [Gigaspora rosea]
MAVREASVEAQRIYEQGLLPSAELLFGANSDKWILQEDNDSKHCATLSKDWKKENNIKQEKNRTLAGLKSCLVKEWNALTCELATKLVRSMERRVEALIEANGDYTILPADKLRVYPSPKEVLGGPSLDSNYTGRPTLLCKSGNYLVSLFPLLVPTILDMSVTSGLDTNNIEGQMWSTEDTTGRRF